MNRRGIKRIVAIGDAKEASAKLEGLGTEARYLFQARAGFERACRVAMRDDRLRKAFADARHAGEERHGGGVGIDADAVHAVFDNGVQ